MDVEKPTSRRRFLRQLGMTLAVGIGAAALPSRSRASAQDNGQCCIASDSRCSGASQCPGGQVKYWCDCLSYSYCTNCTTNIGTCYLAPC